ncbi:MAG: HD domain-containing protein [Lachnospiraceae bacterium]|nr:HD domain-containing protein [Lachnospiraceae bacterium]
MEFLLEMDKSKSVWRQTWLANAERKENDAEHSWHLAVMCLLLGEYANDSIDLLKTVAMVLFHDVIEIEAGDTYAYDEAGHGTKDARERAAAEHLYGILPEDQGEKLKALWEEFEAGETAEAKFARTLDRVQPLMLNDASGGRSWEEHGIAAEQVYRRNELTHTGSEQLWEYARTLIEKNVENGKLRRP